MDGYQLKDAKPIDVLKQAFGEEIILDDEESSRTYVLLTEFSIGQHEYAVLVPAESGKDEEASVFRITRNPAGDPELETIDDDDEWEMVSEIYDEMVADFD
ncbi:DUF1292 domain-containing protein [Paenibacillus sp. J2TS4]|uniref:DUF1292 domain-containing protein n=1 Tax=Paenibacillus sp. J2TS4 TaxID=2807194 RepID=UPI001B2B5AD7|nr:DUF1292 domain-containing protein [Paenibacillus sp. J2TS4]GIP31444.1 hypothetical protein J2TS4_06540 [Paenibacillus sp. J2TS4]